MDGGSMEEASTPPMEATFSQVSPASDKFVKAAEYAYQGAIIVAVLLLLLTAAL